MALVAHRAAVGLTEFKFIHIAGANPECQVIVASRCIPRKTMSPLFRERVPSSTHTVPSFQFLDFLRSSCLRSSA